MRKLFQTVLAALLLIWAAATQALAETRVALVIGNGAYTTANPLPNPGNDALDLSIALEGLGFQVIFGTDLSRTEMADATQRFSDAVQDADVALFFYAGHAFQAGGRNFLLPVDAEYTSGDDLLPETIELSRIMAAMERAPGIKLVFLDACRDNPFGIDAAAAGSDGLARVGTSRDFLISYATQPDNVAYDGIGRNSFFSEALLQHIYTPGQDINDLLITVRRQVLASTGGLQIPWDNSSLTERFVFDRRPRTGSDETMLFQVAAQLRKPEILRYYLDRYPRGKHAQEAVQLLETTPLNANLPVRGVDPADQLWDLARRSRARPLLELYVDTFPDHPQVPEAARLLRVIPPASDASPELLCRRLATHPNDATPRFRGTSIADLGRNATVAIQACGAAVTQAPEQPHLQALLARAFWAAGDTERALDLFRSAAARGDLRATFTLGQIYATGRRLDAPDPSAAVQLYERAAAAGSLDAMTNLAVALFNGNGIAADPDRAIDLLRNAADQGSPEARFNLGVLSRRDVIGDRADALGHFLWAARNGRPDGYAAAATLLDQAYGVPRDTERAADLLLFGVAEDSDRKTIRLLTESADGWQRDTLRAVQRRLQAAGLYDGAIDGLAGPAFADALQAWREGGFNPGVLSDI